MNIYFILDYTFKIKFVIPIYFNHTVIHYITGERKINYDFWSHCSQKYIILERLSFKKSV